MDISVDNIQIDEGLNRIIATVDFRDLTDDGETQSASVIVCIPLKEMAALAEIRSVAIEAAFNFLKKAVAV